MLVTSEPIVEKARRANRLKRFFYFALILVLIIGIAFSSFIFLQRSSENDIEIIRPDLPATISWSFAGQSWISSSNPPECPNPLNFSSPVNLELVSSVEYPGKANQDGFKTEGTFRFDNIQDKNEIEVVLPLDAVLVRGARYIENGEVHFLLDFISECGIMFRFNRLSTLTRFFSEATKELPEAVEGIPEITNFTNQILYSAGTFIASAVGTQNPRDISLDFGVYNLREQNSISQDAEWALANAENKELSFYGVCWPDLLTEFDKEIILKLSGSAVSERRGSDYCD